MTSKDDSKKTQEQKSNLYALRRYEHMGIANAKNSFKKLAVKIRLTGKQNQVRIFKMERLRNLEVL